MTASNFSRALRATLGHEGGYSDHPEDNGGKTNLGITKATLERWRKRPVTEAEMRALTTAEAEAIYRTWYWDAVQGDLLPDGLDFVTFDASVNSGPDDAIRWLQMALGVKVDGKLGPITLRAATNADVVDAITDATDARLDYMRSLDDWKHFKNGWTSRVKRVRDLGVELAGARNTHAVMSQAMADWLARAPAGAVAWLKEMPTNL